MKKYLLSIAVALLTTGQAFAGIFTDWNENITCDVRIGCNLNNIYGHLNTGSRGKIGGYKGGFSASANFRFYPVEEVLAIETGLGIQQKGSKDMTMEGYNSGLQYNPWYLDMPLLASVRVFDIKDEHSMYLDAGIYGAIGVGGRWKAFPDTSGPMFGDDGLLKRADGGLILGLSAILAENFYAGIRYQQSFASVVSEHSAPGKLGKFYNEGFSIRFGIIL